MPGSGSVANIRTVFWVSLNLLEPLIAWLSNGQMTPVFPFIRLSSLPPTSLLSTSVSLFPPPSLHPPVSLHLFFPLFPPSSCALPGLCEYPMRGYLGKCCDKHGGCAATEALQRVQDFGLIFLETLGLASFHPDTSARTRMLVAASPVGCAAAGLFSPPENQPVPSPTHLIVRAQDTLMTCFALIPELATAEMRKNAFPATSPWDSLQTAQTHPQLSLHLAPSRCHVLPGCRK